MMEYVNHLSDKLLSRARARVIVSENSQITPGLLDSIRYYLLLTGKMLSFIKSGNRLKGQVLSGFTITFDNS